MDETRVTLFLKQTNGLRDALYSRDKKLISTAIKQMKFTKQEFAELPTSLVDYHNDIIKRSIKFLESDEDQV